MMPLLKSGDMSLMDISKIFLLLKPKEEEEEESCAELHHAVTTDDHELLSRLLSQDHYLTLINRLMGWGVPSTPLRTAAARGHIRCLQVLLEHGAQVDSLDVKAQTPLFTAVSCRRLDCVSALLQAGADPNGSIYNNSTPVLTAAREGDLLILRQLLQHGAEVNVRPKVPEWASSGTACGGPLYLSAVYRHLDCFRLLLLYGADPDYNCCDAKLLARIKQPKTVLEMCLRYGCDIEYIQLLIDFGANVYLPTLIIDKSTKQTEAVALLLKERVCPKPLKSQVRLAMRRFLPKTNKIFFIDSLNIPPLLKTYLKYNP